MTAEPSTTIEMQPRYSPGEVEQRWYRQWEQSGLFKPSGRPGSNVFVITIPPPNITGELHMGHALTYGIEDILGRFKRMQGYDTLILPGTDHAGIATQNVVEKQLANEGTSRHELGREKFVERVWQWKEQYSSQIRDQFRAMGCSFDWSRERFTMDPDYVDAVLEFFVRLYEEGKIYRGWRVINWCVRCQSAISDIEVEDQEQEGELYYVRYPLKDGSGEVVVATVRPETMLGDVAVAVNPLDERYRDYVGKTALLPLLDRELEIITDPMVSTEFGTGAVKITPAHDFADFEVGERHGLPMPIAIGADGLVTSVGGPYEGETAAEAREHVLRDLRAGGYLVKEEHYRHSVPTCERCGTVLEPLLSEQWFMRMEELAAPAIAAVEEQRVTFVPDRWVKVYLDWMEKIRPWTLSRQLWWGHRIPVYYCRNGHVNVSKSWPEKCSTCSEPIERRDDDVLDTWFSSALWPFATLGWPRLTEDLERYYPTSFMNTSSQIIYLWIARMIMAGLKFMDDVPFPVVLINPTILNKHGQRMSKSLGTGIDPLDLVARYGADALRFGLVTSGSTHEQEIRFSPDRVELARNFANKVWNVSRAVLSNQQLGQEEAGFDLQLTTADRWILSKLQRTIDSVTRELERFELSHAGHLLEEFIWSDLADWYLEIAKIRLYNAEDVNARETARAVLWSVLDRSIRLLQPYMPFLCEEVWQHIRKTGTGIARQLSGWTESLPESITVAPWPATKGNIDTPAEEDMELVMELVRAVRAVRSEYRADPGKKLGATIAAGSRFETLQGSFEIISRLARLEPLAVFESMPEKPEHVVSLLVGGVSVFLPLNEFADVPAERARLGKELDRVERSRGAMELKLKDEGFTKRAPQDVVARERQRVDDLLEQERELRERLKVFGG